MNKKILIYVPRLDLTFDKGVITDRFHGWEGRLPRKRKYWLNFIENLKNYHIQKGDIVYRVELPLWKIDTKKILEKNKNYDIIYVPYRNKHDFECGDKVYYYMQTILPEFFTVSKNGWGRHTSWNNKVIKNTLKLKNDENYNVAVNNFYLFLYSKLANTKKYDVKGKHLFICQPSEDYLLKDDGMGGEDITLKCIEKFVGKFGNTNSFINISSEKQNTIIEYCNKGNIEYLIGNKYSLIESCNSFSTINSPLGFEAMLYNKIIYSFGDSEYNFLTYNIKSATNNKHEIINNLKLYKTFLYEFFSNCISSQKLETYERGLNNKR